VALTLFLWDIPTKSSGWYLAGMAGVIEACDFLGLDVIHSRRA
jgi:hypothetical protein